MSIKISALTSAAALAGTEVLPVVQSSATVGATIDQIRDFCGVKKFAANIGDGTNISYAVTHNIGTRDVHCTVYRNATPYDEVIVDVQHTDVNNVTFLFSTAPTTNQFRVVIWG